MKWQNDNVNFFPRKYRNFHKCPVTVGVAAEYQIKSFDQVIEEMSKVLHFKVEKISYKTVQDLLDLLKKNSCDFLRLSFDGTYFQPIFLSYEYGVFVVPPGSPLDKIEKLMLPFDTETWIWIFGTLLCSFVIVQVTCWLSKRAKDLCFGQNVNSPALNLLSIFFCGSQTRVPGNSLARCIFLTFVVWSLIIRTCFQSLSYRALQMDNRHPSIKTLEDLQRSGFHQFSTITNKGRTSNNSYG